VPASVRARARRLDGILRAGASYADPMAPPSVGTLPWRPALEQLDLLAAPTAATLQAADPGWAADCYASPIDEDLADTAAFCAAYEVPLEASANCVVVSGRRAETTTLAACLVLATDRADVNKAVRHQLGVRKISFAPMAEATERSQMAYGGITPVGLPSEWPVLVDEAVVDQPWVVVGSGTRGAKLLLPGARLAELASAHVMLLRQVG
jgi:prolyl-tRNA editing enzyme YbaK/EbsC (Cys-tRNA(Pro) deacylase)